MALNYSHRPLFPAHVSEDNLFSHMRNVSSCLVDNVPEPIGQDYTRPCNNSQGGETEEWYFNCRSDKVHHCSSPESHSEDIINLLPADPFRMGIQNTFTALTGWLEDLGVDYGGYTRGNIGTSVQEDYSLFAGCKFIWRNSFMFQDNLNEKLRMDFDSFMGSVQFGAKLNAVSDVNQHGEESDVGGSSPPYDIGEKVEVGDEYEGVPHEALAFALNHLGVKDLLSVERVCRSLCSTVRDDPLLWMSIHIEQPLNEKITDDLLWQLACRAQGSLKCLSLVRCPRITDDGIRRILESNKQLTKLFVPGSTRLTIEGILSNIKNHNSTKDIQGIKHLRIGGISGVTRENFEELNLLLSSKGSNLESQHMPKFYHIGDLYLPHDDNRALDIEICPKCENYRLVYDCPSESCLVKEKASIVCRGCKICIPRCAQCGKCINDNEYEETFCLDWLCLDCFEEPPRYQERLEKKVDDVCGDVRKPSCQLDYSL